MRVQTFASFSFGCRVNRAEKEELDRQLLVLGFQYSEKDPSLYIINTCAVTAKAEREVRQFIYQTKRKFPKTKIIITGCAATKWINEGKKFPEVFRAIDNTNKEFIAQLIAGPAPSTSSGQALVHPERKSKGSRHPQSSPILSLKDKFINSGRLFLKIQDGCQRFCTYCIVPYLRGEPKSERIKDLVTIIKNNEKEFKEIILTAINTEAYGFDTEESFLDLIRAILRQTKIARLSFGSINPGSISKDFLRFLEKKSLERRIIKYFHIPLQSGSNKILNLMKRGYTREEFLEKLNQLHQINPMAFLATDIIVGFLDENDRDFEETYNFLRGSPISKFHVFRFSKREKTAAFYMAKRLKEPTAAEKIRRAKTLSELSKRKYQAFLVKHLGKTFPALFLEKKIEGYQEALLDNQIPAFIKTSKNLVGEIKTIKIKKMNSDKLFGEL